MADNFVYIKLIKNTKRPAFAYKNKEENQYKKIDTSSYNQAILTGKESNITVIDIDSYKMNDDKMNDDNIFIKQFKDYLNINTYIVQSPKGGHHLYFNYEPSLYTVASEYNIDIRNDGGIIVAPPSSIDGKYYTVYKNNNIIDIPEDMKQFLLKNICTRENKKDKDKKDKDKKDNDKKDNNKKDNNKKDNINDDYLDNLTNTEKEKIKYKVIKRLQIEKDNKEFFKSYSDFLFFTSAMKKLELKKTWDDFNQTQKGYNKDSNLKVWEGANKDMIPWLLKKLKFTAYELYKPILKNKIEPDIIINKSKLGNDFFKLYDDNNDIKKDDEPTINNYCIKSDTGTGKTTSFREYIKKNNYKFISIVSRISLGQEQYEQFNNNGVDCSFYLLEEIKNNESCIVQLDSITKLFNIKSFRNYILFLDEFNSIVQYLLQSSTLKKHRVNVFTLLIKLIKECKQFICVDADISDLSLNFLIHCNDDFYYIENQYKHNKGIQAEEIHNENSFINKMMDCKKFLCCCDSKTTAEILYNKLGDDTVKLITSDTDEYIKFDDYEKIIFSPKIIYGIDSTIERYVFCYYNEKTISPPQMVQQIARCRNIKKLYFLFTKKKYIEDKTTYNEFKNKLSILNEYGNKEFKMLSTNDIYNIYFKLLCMYEYNNNCYNTNKFGHFINILIDRGFNYTINYSETKINALENKEIKEG